MVTEDGAECPGPHWLTDRNTHVITLKAELPSKNNRTAK